MPTRKPLVLVPDSPIRRGAPNRYRSFASTTATETRANPYEARSRTFRYDDTADCAGTIT
jgi:hypothetical protein